MKAKLLLVDDESRILIVLKAIFGQLYDVYTATDGVTALEILRTTDINVLVSDQRMPKMLGTELLLQAKELKPDVIRILLTGYADFEASMASVNEGEVFRYLFKPWDTHKLVNTVAEAVKVSQQLISAHLEADQRPAGVIDQQQPIQLDVQKMSLLVIGDNQEVISFLSKEFTEKHPVYSCMHLADAMDNLKQHYIGVVIAEATVNGVSTVKFLAALRAANPTIVTLVLSAHRDVTLISDMINSGQIFRFLPNPPGMGILRLSAKSAIKQHHVFKKNPLLTARINGDLSLFEDEKEPSEVKDRAVIKNDIDNSFVWLRRTFRRVFNAAKAH